MTSAPLVSAVIPAYNAARTVGDAIESVLGQTMQDFEVLVVDDGSADDTAGAAKAIADTRVRVLSQSNEGVSAARNAGIDAAKGRYVAFLDADDLWLPHKLECQLDFLRAHPDTYAVQAGVKFVNDAGRVLDVRRCRPWRHGLLDVLRFENLPAFPTTLIAERDKLEERGGFDTSLAILEDWELAIYAIRHWTLQSIEEPLALYRVHPSNRSRDVGVHVEPGLVVLERLFSDPSLPPEVAEKRDEAYARLYTMLAGGAFNGRQWKDFVRWSGTALRKDPTTAAYMVEMPLRRLRRRLSRTRGSGVAA